MRTPFFVQRINRRKSANETSKGVDRHFLFDYMGSAEFEFGGLLQEALRRMREGLDRLQILQTPTPAEGVKRLWFLGEPEYLPQAVALLEDQLGRQKAHLKERTHMRESLITPGVGAWGQHDAWWALDTESVLNVAGVGDGDRPWLIFVQKADAQQWLKDLQHVRLPKERAMTREENAVQEAIRKLREEGLEPLPYSGKNMYGSECVSVRVDSREEAGALKAVIGVMPKTDNRGLRVIAYWPSLPWSGGAS